MQTCHCVEPLECDCQMEQARKLGRVRKVLQDWRDYREEFILDDDSGYATALKLCIAQLAEAVGE